MSKIVHCTLLHYLVELTLGRLWTLPQCCFTKQCNI